MAEYFSIDFLMSPLDFMYWIKTTFAYIVTCVYSVLHKRNRFDIYDFNSITDPVKLGVVEHQLEKDMESPFPESHLQEAADEVLFYGVNSKSECLLVRVSRGLNQVSDAWIHLKLSNGKCYELAESAGPQHPFEGGKCPNFSCGKLQMHYLSPMRRWRIFYCGMLKWKASSNIYDLTNEINPGVLASASSRTEWKNPLVPPIDKFIEVTNFYAQSGAINGTVTVNNGDEYEMYLFGDKSRNLGKSSNITGSSFTNILGNTPGNGFTFHLGKASIPYICKNLPYGFVVQPDAILKTVKELDIVVHRQNDGSIKSMTVSFNAGNKYDVCGTVIGDPIVLCSGNSDFEASFIEITVGNKNGYGFIISEKVYKERKEPKKYIIENSFPKIVPLTVLFSDDVSRLRDISGGKGSSLGKLMKLSKKEKTFSVPQGVIVTTAAYQEFMTTEILTAVKHLEDVLYGKVEGTVEEASDKVSDVIVRTILPQRICHSIIENLKFLFGNDLNVLKFAVRSSSTGEDTEAMSSAGQLDTFLGIQDLKKIFLCVKKCWASQFSQRAVQYKKRYGQILNSPMAVVIQEMVACEVSGVLFTCDPVTNNPSVITITANYGLGETVVSGSVEPDTITLKRDANGEIEVASVLLGAKHQKLVMQESSGTATEETPKDARRRCCLSTPLAERLGALSLKIEKYYRSSRDIEWGIAKDNVYILQSRPVTNAAVETEFEITHEFDGPLRSENDYCSVVNLGEVMPGALSTLGMDLFLKTTRHGFKNLADKTHETNAFMANAYYYSGYVAFYYHILVDVVEFMCIYGLDSPLTEGLMIGMFGRMLDDPDLLAFAREKKMSDKGQSMSIWKRILILKNLFFHDWGLEKLKHKIEKCQMNFLEHKTAKEAFSALLSFTTSCIELNDVNLRHLICTGMSSVWNMVLFRLLRDANKGFDNDVYGDFARLLATTSNIESANIPHAMQEVADQITMDIGCEKFKSWSVKDALNWLETSPTQAGIKFRQFIKRHGHRCLKEIEVRSVTWAMNPNSLVKLLQNLVVIAKHNEKKKEKDGDKLLSDLHVQLGFLSRCMLKFILPNCRKGIRAREATKSLYLKSIDVWRQGFRHLAKKMVLEGRLPDIDLIFFLSIDEINDLLETRSPIIVSRSITRRKMFPKLDEYRFPEITKGAPRPIIESNYPAETYKFADNLTMKGLPVSQGVARGYARVALTLEEASKLKQGEILITFVTDICWSPYFTIISGVVTELGGLMSHGAVVTREYGLPCVTGMHDATKRFQTGDYVLLDGKKGILQRLPQPI